MTHLDEATVSLVEREDGWRIRLIYDDGNTFLSDQAFPTKTMAQDTINIWVETYGIKQQTVQ